MTQVIRREVKGEIRKCPRCGGQVGVVQFECPHCQCVFCGECLKNDPEGQGETIKCPNPHCGMVLKLPFTV